jgi:hypothetical protein
VGVTSRCGLTTDASGRGTKRPAPDDESAEESAADSKRVRDDGQPEPDMTGEMGRRGADEEHDLNLPLPWEGGVPCLVKVNTLAQNLIRNVKLYTFCDAYCSCTMSGL